MISPAPWPSDPDFRPSGAAQRAFTPRRRLVAFVVVAASCLVLAGPGWTAEGTTQARESSTATPTATIAARPVTPPVRAAITRRLSAATPAPTVSPPPRRQTMSRQTLDGHGVDVVHPGRSITALVVVLHRLNSTPTNVRSETALEDPARARGWLLVYPSGYKSSWNSGRCCGSARDEDIDDSTFLRDLIIDLRGTYRLGNNVPTVMGGVSNGAMETAQMFCRYPGLLDGAFLDAGNAEDQACTKSARVKQLLIMRGVKDTMVPMAGTMYSSVLGTPLFSDAALISAARFGSRCRSLYNESHGGISSRVDQCDDRTMKIMYDQSGHSRYEAPRAGVFDRTYHTVALIDGVVRRVQREGR